MSPAVPTATSPLFSHCHCCGAAYASMEWPRACASCHHTQYDSPGAVAVALVPVSERTGTHPFAVLAVVRAIAPGIGKPALPGGFMEKSESFEQGALRELRQETGLDLPSARIMHSASTPNGQVLVFCRTPAITRAQAEALRRPGAQLGDGENSDVIVIPIAQFAASNGPLVFPLHNDAVRLEYAALLAPDPTGADSAVGAPRRRGP